MFVNPTSDIRETALAASERAAWPDGTVVGDPLLAFRARHSAIQNSESFFQPDYKSPLSAVKLLLAPPWTACLSPSQRKLNYEFIFP